MARRLDFWSKAETFAWLDARETDVFARYFELGAVHKLVDELAPQCNGLARHTFYAWLHAVDGRWEKFEEIREARAYQTAEEGYAVAEGTEQATANADRLKFEGKMRAAEHMNRNAFGKRPEVQVAIGVGGEWSQALNAALEHEIAIAGRPSPTGNIATRATGLLEPGPRTVPEQGEPGPDDAA